MCHVCDTGGVKSSLQVGWQGVSDLQHRRCKELFTGGLARCIISAIPSKELFTGEIVRCVISATLGMDFFVLQTLIYIILFLYSKHKNIKTSKHKNTS